VRTTRHVIASASAAFAVILGACAAKADDQMLSNFLVAPGKYVLYNCQQLNLAARENQKRIAELEALMAKSGNGFINAMAYQPEYLQLRGELADMQREGADKKCKTAPGEKPRPVQGAVIR